MKPANFEYFAPTDLADALALLELYGEEAKILAGGQSLMPLMNMRLVRPKTVVDINGISELAYITEGPDGGVAIGGLTRQRAVESSSLVHERAPVLAEAMPFIGHFQIRNRGTIGGSLVHGDPAAELPALSLALGAEIVLVSTRNQRVMKAEDFFVTSLSTVIEPVEVLTQLRIPHWGGGWGWGFQEVCRREGDFALVGSIGLVQLDDRERCQAARVTMFGVAGTPVRVHRAEQLMMGERVSNSVLEDVARVVSLELEPDSDLHASAEYRKEVGGVMARRALEMALGRAAKGGPPE